MWAFVTESHKYGIYLVQYYWGFGVLQRRFCLKSSDNVAGANISAVSRF